MKILSRRGLAATFVFSLIAASVAIFPTANLYAQNQRPRKTSASNIDPKRLATATTRARNSTNALTAIMRAPDSEIPKELLERAQAIAVFPGVLRGAFIVGGRKGAGVISKRTAMGWSAPAFFTLGGGSIGAQIGGDKTDIVLLFMNDGALKGLLEDKFEMGGEIGVAAGPYGRNPSATTNLTLDAGILSYARSKGAYIGAALKGSVINPDNNLNEAIYGGKKANEILGENALMMNAPEVPAGLRGFTTTVARYAAK